MLRLSLMVIFILIVFGLIFGSFVEALVWRLHEQEELSAQGKGQRKINKQSNPQSSASSPNDLSILKGRSMCPSCGHRLAGKDLVPVLSWVELRGKCRYCRQPIGWQALVLELMTAGLFVALYYFWPVKITGLEVVNFIGWLVISVGLIAMFVYDARWLILPNRVIYPLLVLALGLGIFNTFQSVESLTYLRDLFSSVLIGGGLFYGLFAVSKGRWIGGGDVKLGLLIGLLIADPLQSFLVLFAASLLGTLVVLPGLVMKKIQTTSHIPFGPFLIVGLLIVKLFGDSIIAWYKSQLLIG